MDKKNRAKIDSGGGPVFMGNVNNKGTIKGRSDKYHIGMSADEASELFNKLFMAIDHHRTLSQTDKADLKVDIQEVREELEKEEQASESFILRRLRNIARMAPDIFEVTLATITNPTAGFGMIAQKIAKRARAES